jgi:hypothetical protein
MAGQRRNHVLQAARCAHGVFIETRHGLGGLRTTGSNSVLFSSRRNQGLKMAGGAVALTLRNVQDAPGIVDNDVPVQERIAGTLDRVAESGLHARPRPLTLMASSCASI